MPPRRIAVTPDDIIWYTDYARGYLGRFDPNTGGSKEYASPGGPQSQPYGALSEQRQVACVWRSALRPKRPLGREGAPLGQRGEAPLFVNLAGGEMALLIEMVVDLGMN